jgi:hypothetical protein
MSSTNTKPYLTMLPPEIHLKLFDLFDDDQSSAACLGLTCKKFYPLFRARQKKVLLLLFRWRIGHRFFDGLLVELIRTWMPRDLEYCPVKRKIVTKARILGLEAETQASEKG